jgi:branched-chain amino acid transport system substrate-binding protein
MTSGRIAVAALLTAALLAAHHAAAQEKLKIGFVSTFTGPAGVLGKHMYDGFMLALDHAGGKLGGLETEILKSDDQLKPDIGLQVTKQFVTQDKVDFVVGFAFSNVLIAASRPVFDAKTFVISGTAGPKELAGAACSPWYFSAAPENDMHDEAAGAYASKAGYKHVYLMAPNYSAGRDAVESFKLDYKGEILGEDYTKLDQMDFAAELAQLRAAKPDLAYVFFPGGLGINFIKQFSEAGLMGQIPLLSKATTDMTTLAAQGDAAIGNREVTHWALDLDNAANKRFVDDFTKKYGYPPSPYAENSYDAGQMIDAAIRAVNGKIADKDGLRKALERADIASPRGPFKMNRDHYPIEDEYMVEVTKRGDGSIVPLYKETLVEGKADRFAADCKMP